MILTPHIHQLRPWDLAGQTAMTTTRLASTGHSEPLQKFLEPIERHVGACFDPTALATELEIRGPLNSLACLGRAVDSLRPTPAASLVVTHSQPFTI
jgi:hypothetical protein